MNSFADEIVVRQLNELFGNSLNTDVIRKVAKACSFDVNESSNRLLEMSNKAASPKRKSKKATDIENAIANINKGYKVLVLLRGLPGSGKSTLAKHILQSTVGYDQNTTKLHVLSTDDYFVKNGRYVYDPAKISEAHGWNHQRAFAALSKGYSPVIVDNTNTEMWEMKPYALMATDYGYIIEILEPDTHWCFNDSELAKRNKHGVPKGRIRQMLERFERNVTSAKLRSAYDCRYKLQKPPQMRLFPPVNLSSPVAVGEIIDLMDFSESSSNVSPVVPCRDNFVDNMLMYRGTSPVQATVLTPSKPFPDIETTWGVNEQALRSWDIVTPIEDDKPKQEPFVVVVEADCKAETRDCSTSTEDDCRNSTGRILECFSRDINRNTPVRSPGISKKLMLDKSCLTEEFSDDKEVYVEQLSALFPDVSPAHLNYWYGKCKGDVEWTIEILLSQKDEAVILSSDDEPDLPKEESKIDSPKPTDKQKRKSPSSEELTELKKCIEQKVTINEDCYSDYLKKVRSRKNGVTIEDAQDAVMEFVYSDDESDMEIMSAASDEPDEETMEINLGEKFVEQLEMKFAEQSLVYPKGFQPVVQVPVTLAKQLYTFYIESVFQQMEAQNFVLDTMVKEDEEFARNLQKEEESSKIVAQSPNLKSIMSEQAELSKQEKERAKWKELTPDTLSAKLTRLKLFKSFPYTDQNVLVEILQAHDNIYKDTVETLLVSLGPPHINGDVDSIKEPPLEESVIKEMRNAQGAYAQKQDENGGERSAQSYRDEAQQYYARRSELYQKANEYQSRGMTEVAMFYSGLASRQTAYFERANSMAAMAFVDEHSKRLQDFNTLDLHFLYVKEVVPALDVFIDRNINLLRHSAAKHTEYLQIITGRGKRSENGQSKIKPVVEARLKRRKIIYQYLNPGLLKIKVTKTSQVTSELDKSP